MEVEICGVLEHLRAGGTYGQRVALRLLYLVCQISSMYVQSLQFVNFSISLLCAMVFRVLLQ